MFLRQTTIAFCFVVTAAGNVLAWDPTAAINYAKAHVRFGSPEVYGIVTPTPGNERHTGDASNFISQCFNAGDLCTCVPQICWDDWSPRTICVTLDGAQLSTIQRYDRMEGWFDHFDDRFSVLTFEQYEWEGSVFRDWSHMLLMLEPEEVAFIRPGCVIEFSGDVFEPSYLDPDHQYYIDVGEWNANHITDYAMITDVSTNNGGYLTNIMILSRDGDEQDNPLYVLDGDGNVIGVNLSYYCQQQLGLHFEKFLIRVTPDVSDETSPYEVKQKKQR